MAQTATKATRSTSAKAGATRRKTAATNRSTTAKKAAATRSRNRAAATRKRALTAQKAAITRSQNAKTPVDRAAEYAERAVLIPVGVALEARDQVLTTVNDLLTTYSTRSKAETQLKRFERRGTRARNQLEREVRKTRTRVERQLRQRRRRVERTLNGRSTSAKTISAQVEQVSAQAQNAVQTGITAGTGFATKVQERVLSVA